MPVACVTIGTWECRCTLQAGTQECIDCTCQGLNAEDGVGNRGWISACTGMTEYGERSDVLAWLVRYLKFVVPAKGEAGNSAGMPAACVTVGTYECRCALQAGTQGCIDCICQGMNAEDGIGSGDWLPVCTGMTEL